MLCASVSILLEPPKNKCKPGVSKRRKGAKDEEEEENGERKEGAKRQRGPSGSEPFESHDSDAACPRLPDSSAPFDKTHKSHFASKAPAKREKSQSPVGPERWTQKKHPSPWAADEEAKSQSAGGKRPESEKPRNRLSQLANPGARCNGIAMETGASLEEERRGEGSDGGAEEADSTRHDGNSHSEDSEAVSALLAYQESERLVSMETSACLVFGALPGECELPENELNAPDAEVKSSDYATAEAAATAAPGSESETGAGQREEPTARHPSPVGQGVVPDNAGGADKPTSPSDSRPVPKNGQGVDAAPKPKSSPRPSTPPEGPLKLKQPAATDLTRPHASVSPESCRHQTKRPGSSPNGSDPEPPLHSGQKTQPGPCPPNPPAPPNQTPSTFPNKAPMPAAMHTKTHMPVPIHTTAAATKPHTHTHAHTHPNPAVTPTRAPAVAAGSTAKSSSAHAANRGAASTTPSKLAHVSCVTPTKTHGSQSRTSVLHPSPLKSPAKSSAHAGVNTTTPTKSPLIVDRNEPFTVYRDPALVGDDPDISHPQGNVAYIHPSPHGGHGKHSSLASPTPRPAAQAVLGSSAAAVVVSSGNPSLPAPRATHASPHSATHLSPPPSHAPHLLKTPSPSSQSALSSLGTHVLPPAVPPHHPGSLPHPHLLPSLLPALSPSAALLAAGHGPLGALGLTPHPLSLPPSPALLGQTPLGLYPLLWPPYPNGTHPYTALGLSAGMAEGSLKRVRGVLVELFE